MGFKLIIKTINKMKFIKKIAILALAVTAFAGCKKDFFDLPDPNGIDSDIWNDEGAVNLFLNKGYDLIMPTWPAPGNIHNTSDETNNANTALLYGTLVENSVTDIGTGVTITTNRYFDIRRCNVAIEGIAQGTLPEDVKARLAGQFYFLRAFVYFNLVRLYGGVPLVLNAQELNAENLSVPRSPSSACFEAIVKDLDSAALTLPTTWGAAEKGRITKGAALALKGKALLYWASPQFNTTNDVARWERAYTACKAAYDTCLLNGYALNPTYATIFTDETSGNKEPIIVRVHDAISVSPGRGTNTEYVTRPRSETAGLGGGGSNQPTWNLVRAYPMNNGLPITNATSGYDSVLFWRNRDPRFNASISYNGDVWPLSGKTGRKQWNYTGVLEEGSGLTVTGFYTKKITNPILSALQTLYNSNSGGGSGMDWVEMRFAEVLVNLAECAAVTNKIAEAKSLIRILRQRAGIIQGSQDYGLGIANTETEMRNLIMNERMVEFAMEGKRYHDLRRTRRFHLLTGTVRQGIVWLPKSPYFAGVSGAPSNVPNPIYLDKPDALGVRPRDTANLNNPAVYNAMFTVAISSADPTTPINFPQNYYHYALPTNFVQSSFVIEQTLGWAGGSFDPIK